MESLALHKLSYGIYILSTVDGDQPFGCIINTAFQITSAPPQIAVSCNRDNFTHDKIVSAQKFGISVLGEGASAETIKLFGYCSGRDTDKFAGISFESGEELALPLFPQESVATFECRLVNQLEVGTHTVFIGEVVQSAIIRGDVTEMTYRYYHEVLKGAAPKNAPTYLPEEGGATEAWKCSVCGYVYDGDVPFEELGEDWVCPLCGVGKEMFNKV